MKYLNVNCNQCHKDCEECPCEISGVKAGIDAVVHEIKCFQIELATSISSIEQMESRSMSAKMRCSLKATKQTRKAVYVKLDQIVETAKKVADAV